MLIYLLVTERCNLHCSFCIRGKKLEKELTVDELKHSAWVKTLEHHDVVITGGEPTLNPEFGKIVDFISKRAKHTIITSNGTTDNLLSDQFDPHKVLFQISIDGPRDAHNKIRGENAFQRSWETLQLLADKQLNYCVASVVNRANISAMPQLADELKTLSGITYWKLSSEMPFGDANIKDVITAREWNQFVQKIISVAQVRLNIRKLFPFDLFDKHYEKLENSLEKIRTNCGSGKTKCYIYPDLSVYPCTCLTDFCIGKASDDSVESIIHGLQNQKFLHYTVTDDTKCKDCKYLKFCNGGCIGMSYHFAKRLGAGDIRCPLLEENA